MATPDAKPVILLAFANSSANPLPHLAGEYHRLEMIGQQATQKGLCELVVAPYATIDDILNTFQDERYRGRIAVFHYAGHADSYELLLQDADGQSVVADAGGLAAFFGHQTCLQLIFLNGCSTQPQVQSLLNAGVAVVIATSQAIADQVATNFAARFYQFLADGDAIGVAFTKAQAVIQTTYGGNVRHLYAITGQDTHITSRWPWDRYVRPGAEAALHWNLPDAANDPLFGLPPIAKKYYQRLPDNPFRGLTWFTTDHAALFFGRGYQIRALYHQIVAPHTPPLILFYGQSGVGKSSLLAAGLTPRLESSHTILYLRRDQKQGLVGTLQAALTTKASVTPLANAWATVEEHDQRPLLVILDQAEEIFTRPHPSQPHELADFLAALEALGAQPEHWPQGKLILGFRKEWLAEVKRQVEEHKLPYTELFLQRLDKRGVIEAIAGPTQLPALQAKYRLAVGSELTGLIADDLLVDPGSAVAPTLQILLTKLWEAAKQKSYDQPTLDEELYTELRKQGLGLGDILDQQMAELGRLQPEVVASGLALDLLALHTTALGTAEERTREDLCQSYAHRQEMVELLVQECSNLYLLVDPIRNEPAKPPASRLAHDTLAPLVRQRFDMSDAPGQRARRILDSRGIDWRDGKQGVPLDDTDLALVEQGHGGMRSWDADEVRLVEASRREKQRREDKNARIQREREDARRYELKQAQKLAAAEHKRRQAVTLGLIGTIVLLLIALGFGWFANLKAVESERQAKLTLAQSLLVNSRMLGEAKNISNIQLAQARLLAVESYRLNEQYNELEANKDLSRNWLEQMVLTYPFVNQPHISLTGHTDKVLSAIWSSDGHQLASSSSDNTIIIWNGRTGQKVQTLTGHKKGVVSMAWSSDRDHLVTASDDHTIIIWDTNSWKPIRTLTGHKARVNSVALSPDETYLASASSDKTVIIWDTNNWQQRQTLTAHSTAVNSVSWAPDRAQLVSASCGQIDRNGFCIQGKMVVWETDSWQPIQILTGHTDWINSIAWSSNGAYLASASADMTVTIWKTQTWQQQQTLIGHLAWVNSVNWSSDSTRLVSASADGKMIIWDIAMGQPMQTLVGHTKEINSVAWSPDGMQLVSSSSDNTIIIWDVSRWQQFHALVAHKHQVTGLAWSTDDTLLASASGDGTVIIWDTNSWKPLRILDNHKSIVFDVAWSPDGQFLASADDDGTIIIWDTNSWEVVEKLTEHLSSVHGVSWSPEGTYLASASSDNTVIIWSASNWQPFEILTGHRDWVNGLAWSPTDERLATASSDGTIIIWNTNNWQRIKSLSVEKVEIYEVAWSPNGRRIAAALYTRSAREKVIIWDTDSWQQIRSLTEHADRVFQVAWSPDGKHLASASGDNTVIIWDTNSWQSLYKLTEYVDSAVNVTWSSDSAYLATGTAIYDRRIIVWELDFVRVNCKLAHRNLTWKEWKQYLPDQPYRQTCKQWPVDQSVPTDNHDLQTIRVTLS